MPRLSYRSEAMSFIANPSASIFNELFLPGSIGELPSRSVGPEPEMNSTTGIAFVVSCGKSRVLWIAVSAGTASIEAGGEEGCCPDKEQAIRVIPIAVRMCRLSLHLSSRHRDFRQGTIRETGRRLRV